jgi:tRNA-splicing ligase RtcB
MPTMRDNVLSWASDIEDATLQQAAKTARMPFVQGHVALMPDAHVGFGSTVGSVFATKGAIIPSAIGVDIGCGMIAARLNLTSQALPDNLGPLHGRIREAVPAGVGKGHEEPTWAAMDEFPEPTIPLTDKQQTKAVKQFGSLGSGNHFVEVCLDEEDRVWVVLHSGSRGIGNELAQQHIENAKGLMKRYFIDLEDPDLAYLVEGTPEFDAYIAAMLWAQDYAMGNRDAMMDAVLRETFDFLGFSLARWTECHVTERVNCHHNFTALENHHGKNVWLTRKGAIRAREGDKGVIPGSMGTRSYIVSGLGNPASFSSCSHGAGRRLSRGKARRQLDLDGLREQMAGKVWNDRDAEALLDEDPRAYKDIDAVMEDQRDLVKVEHTLHQILNYKGT